MSAFAAATLSVTGILAVCTGVALVSRSANRTRAARDCTSTGCAGESRLVSAAVAFGAAACDSVAALRSALGSAMLNAAPSADGVLVYEDRDGALVCVAAFGERFAYYAGTSIALSDEGALPARAIAAGHRVRLGTGTRALHPRDRDAVALPLAIGAGRHCAIAIAARARLDEPAVTRLAMLAELVSPAYRIALDREDDRHRAEYDGLTGLLTPRAFRQRLTALLERARLRPVEHLSLLFVDTDRFKRWNDTYGHAAGDALLRELAHLLRAFAASERDLVARNGGDEFCVVLRETGKADAIERAEALRERIASADLGALRPATAEQPVAITASIGVAAFPADAATASELLERADAAMYHSKATGRDAVAYLGPEGAFVRFRCAATASASSWGRSASCRRRDSSSS